MPRKFSYPNKLNLESLMKVTLLHCIFLVIFSVMGRAQNWSEIVKLETSDQELDDNHAISVAISGDYAIAGAWHEDHDGAGGSTLDDAGAAYVYHYDAGTEEWTEEAKLVAADRESGDVFGISVDISGTYAVIGAVEENGAQGAAYVFERNNLGIWVQISKLEAPIRQSSDRFGYSVAISENVIVVGAHHEDEDENDAITVQNAGSAYIFNRTSESWEFFQKIVASDRDVNDEFGYSVNIHNDKIISGAYKYDPEGEEIGGAYVFSFDEGSWTEIKKLQAFTPYSGDRFGYSVDVNENFYIIGAPYHDYDEAEGDLKNNAGAAYIFDAGNSWAEDKVVSSSRNDQDNLGEDVAIFGSIAVVGSPLQDYDVDGEQPFFSDGGAALIYEKDGSGFWNEIQKLVTQDRFTGDKFGHSVDIDNLNILGGAPNDNQDAPPTIPSTGALYVFQDLIPYNIDDIDLNSSINVYPNPTNGLTTIDLGRNQLDVNLTVSNIFGEIIFSNYYSKTDLINFELEASAGIYFATINFLEKPSYTLRLIKN